MNLTIKDYVYIAMLLGLTMFTGTLMTERSSNAAQNVGYVSTDRVITEARSYLRKKTGSAEQAEIELISFANYIQINLDALSNSPDVDILINADIVLGGEYNDFTRMVFEGAKQDYEKVKPGMSLLSEG